MKIKSKNFTVSASSNGFCQIPDLSGNQMVLNSSCNGYIADTYMITNIWYLQVRSATSYAFVPQGTTISGTVYYIDIA